MRQVTEYTASDGTRTYRVRYRLGKQQSSETFRRKQDAQTFAAILDGGGVPDALAWLDARNASRAAITFGEWFEQYVAQLTGVTPRTRADYQAVQRRYLSSLDALPVNLITRGHVSGIVNELERAKKSPKTIKNTIHLLSSVMAMAVEEGHAPRNPCRRVRLPKRALGGQEPRFLTYAEAGALVAATAEHYQPLVTFLVGTGLRWSEATALQSRHVNLQAGTVRVEQAWKRIPGGFEIGAPKSAKSWRTVNAAVPALVAVAPLLGKPNELVFRTPTGKPISHSNFYTRIWTPACEAAGLDPRPRIHDLRHTHASWLISDGIQLEAVQDQLGHESILTTRQVYGHLLPALGVKVGQSASAALAGALRQGPQIAGRSLALDAVQHPDH